MNKFVIGIIGLSLLVLIGGVLLVSSKDQGTPIDPATLQQELSITESDWSKGPQDAPATLVEYSDLQCPACASYHPILTLLNEEFGDQLRFVYRHYPIRQIHPNAEDAARAAEAAGRQGKFWEMHDLLFENQDDWANESDPSGIFEEYAKGIDLDLEQYRTDIESDEVREAINADYQSGLRLGVNATPTFFFNGQVIQNPRNYEEFKSLIGSNQSPAEESEE
jgi:protein-disulfide isomerase